MRTCNATHWFSTDTPGTRSACTLADGHDGPHLDVRDRWWESHLVGAVEQPMPTPNASTPIVDLVLADLRERDRIGRERYGTPLQAHNGRDSLRDAYEEALDLAIYLRQHIEERHALTAERDALAAKLEEVTPTAEEREALIELADEVRSLFRDQPQAELAVAAIDKLTKGGA